MASSKPQRPWSLGRINGDCTDWMRDRRGRIRTFADQAGAQAAANAANAADAPTSPGRPS